MLRRYAFILLLVAAANGLHGMASQPPAVGLFVDRPDLAAQRPDVAARPDTLRVRPAEVNPQALQQDALDLTLFEGTTLRAVLDRRSANPDGSASWSGRVDNDPLSAVTFVQSGAIVQGSIRTMDAAYTVEPIPGSTLYDIRQVDLAQLGPELPPLVPSAAALAGAALDEPPMSGDDGTTFDVLVAYTSAAVTAAGSTDALLARINLGVTETNTGYANSGVIPRLRLVGTQLVAYTESGDLNTDLSAVTGTGDGQMDTIHALRNSLGADLVKLVVGNTAGSACGVAWLMQSLSSAFASNAFSVTAYPCISPNYTFGHELGHNMGSNHAPEDGPVSPPLYAYSFGYKHPGNLFRTVMAYNCGGSGCPRVLYFSNPSVNYSGAPTGTLAQHNNALSINNARNTISNWRQQVAANTPPTITAVANQAIAEDGVTAALGFTVADGQTAATGLAVSATSSNLSLVPNTSAALAVGGAGASRTLTVTPQPNASGVSTITVSVSDGVLSTSTTFVLTVTAVNDPPVVSAIAAQTINEDQSVVVPFTISDVETAAASLSLQAVSSNVSLVGGTGLVLGGSGADRTLTLTPAAEQWGTATVTITVSDGATSVPRLFSFAVLAVNDPPTMSGVPPLVSTTLGVPTSFAITVADPDSSSGSLSLTGGSWNTTLLTNGGIAVTTPQPAAAPYSRTFLVTLTPAAGQTGAGGLTLSASDSVVTVTAPVSFTVTTVPTAPDAPTALSSSAAGTTVAFDWTPALTGSAPTSFVVEMGTAPGTTTLPTQAVLSPAAHLSLALPAGTYYARVRAVNAVGQSTPSPETSVTVAESSPIPGPPGNFSATTSGTTVHFTWTASSVGAAASRYLIEAGSAPGLANLASLDTAGLLTSLSVPNVPPGTYWIRVRGANVAGTGAPSQDVSLVMGASGGCVGLPAAPVLLTPVVSGVNVSLSWNAPTLGRAPSGYVIYAGSAPGLSNLASFGTGNAATSFAGSAPAGAYFVRIAAANACGVGPASNEASFTLGMDLPGAPQNLAASVAPGGLVTLTWEAPASGGAAMSYLVEAGSSAGLIDLATVSTGSASTSFNAAAPPGAYFVRVRAVNGSGASAPSAEVAVVVP